MNEQYAVLETYDPKKARTNNTDIEVIMLEEAKKQGDFLKVSKPIIETKEGKNTGRLVRVFLFRDYEGALDLTFSLAIKLSEEDLKIKYGAPIDSLESIKMARIQAPSLGGIECQEVLSIKKLEERISEIFWEDS